MEVKLYAWSEMWKHNLKEFEDSSVDPFATFLL